MAILDITQLYVFDANVNIHVNQHFFNTVMKWVIELLTFKIEDYVNTVEPNSLWHTLTDIKWNMKDYNIVTRSW